MAKMSPYETEIEKTLANGFTVTLRVGHKGNGFEVDMWNENGDNHWSLFFNKYNDARHEYDRWKD